MPQPQFNSACGKISFKHIVNMQVHHGPYPRVVIIQLFKHEEQRQYRNIIHMIFKYNHASLNVQKAKKAQ